MRLPSQEEMDLPTVLASHTQAANGPGASTIPGSALPSSAPSFPVKRQGKSWLSIVLVVALLIVLLASASLAYLYYANHNPSPPSAQIVGHAFFVSSGLLNQNNNQGITDVLQINLDNVQNPQPGKSYYAWLLNDHQTNVPALALGAVAVDHGHATKRYANPSQANLLANYGRFLITEEDANQPPTNPSPDTSTWRYYAFFSVVPNPNDTQNHFSLLDHLRHLLSQDPKLQKVGLTGGLDIWVFRNTTKILEAAGSARDAQKRCTPDPNDVNCAFVHRTLVRILDYLDGSTYAQIDVPPGTGVLIDPTIARVALLTFDPVNQQPPGYLEHIGNHLREVTESPGVTPSQRALAIRVNTAINNVQGWLGNVHTDAVKLVHMNNTQLAQADALSTLNDMLTQANFAFVGQFDPNTRTVKEGVVEIHYSIQGLATFEIMPCAVTNGKNSCAF
jgi:eukaryotic-like serine/threonine-protein kinase